MSIFAKMFWQHQEPSFGRNVERQRFYRVTKPKIMRGVQAPRRGPSGGDPGAPNNFVTFCAWFLRNRELFWIQIVTSKEDENPPEDKTEVLES